MSQQKQDIACQQVLVSDSSVFSVQWSDFPSVLAEGLSPEVLLARYLSYLRRTTLSIIQPVTSPSGIEFRLLGRNISLISFLPPAHVDSGIALRICGGILVQRRQCHRGELIITLNPVENGSRITLQLSDYCPLLLGSSSPSFLRRWMYRLTQAAIHRLVTVRFLKLLYREQGGRSLPVRVTRVMVKEGRPV